MLTCQNNDLFLHVEQTPPIYLNKQAVHLGLFYDIISFPPSRPDGYLYDKEAILENILHQKKESE